MKRVVGLVFLVTSLAFALGATPSRAGAPPNPTASSSGNTAGGTNALIHNTTGLDNTAFGDDALSGNTDGRDNAAVGFQALTANTTGTNNSAFGLAALGANSNGNDNTACGVASLFTNTSGSANTAVGLDALQVNTTGTGNTAVGHKTFSNKHDGNNNIALGNQAGFNLTSGSWNIYLGNPGKPTETKTIRLGQNQKLTYIAGIADTPVSGSTVVVNNKGQLGVFVSSARYKRDIHTMADSSQQLLDLRPVTFRYKQDPSGERQYGLVAEEVARVYPELVTRTDTGEVQSVKYEELIPMLLNELQHQRQVFGSQMASLQAALEDQREQNAAMMARVSRLEEAARGATTVALR